MGTSDAEIGGAKIVSGPENTGQYSVPMQQCLACCIESERERLIRHLIVECSISTLRLALLRVESLLVLGSPIYKMDGSPTDIPTCIVRLSIRITPL